jgi:WD40 repeat protein
VLAFSRDGSVVATSCAPRVCIWNTQNGAQRTVDVGREQIFALDFNPNGTALAIGRYHEPALLVFLGDARAPVVLEGARGPTLSVAFSPLGNQVAVASLDGVAIFDDNGKPSASRRFDEGISAVAFADAPGETLGAASRAGVIFAASNLASRYSPPGMSLDPSSPTIGNWLGFEPNGERVLVSPGAHLWEQHPVQEVMRFVDPATLLRFGGPGRLVGAHRDWAFVLPIERARGELARLPVHSPLKVGRGVDFSGDARRLAVCDDGGVSIFEHGAGGWQPVARTSLDGGGMGVRISPDGRAAASWKDLTLVLAGAGQNNAPLHWQASPGTSIRDAIFSDDAQWLAVAMKGEVTLLRTAAPHERIRLEAHERHVTQMGFSADGQHFASRTARTCNRGMPAAPSLTSVYDAATGQRLAWHTYDDDGPSAGCRPPEDGAARRVGDMGLLAQATRWLRPFKDSREIGRAWAVEIPSQDPEQPPATRYSVTLREIASGRSLNLVHHDAAILDIDLSPDERWLATAGADGTVRIWPVTSDDLIEQACQRLPSDTPAPSDGPGEHRLLCPPREPR